MPSFNKSSSPILQIPGRPVIALELHHLSRFSFFVLFPYRKGLEHPSCADATYGSKDALCQQQRCKLRPHDCCLAKLRVQTDAALSAHCQYDSGFALARLANGSLLGILPS